MVLVPVKRDYTDGAAPGALRAAAAARAPAAEAALARQVEDLAQRAAACEARLGSSSEGAAERLRKMMEGTGVEQFKKDMQSGSARLMLKEDAFGTSQPVRVVATVVVRIWSKKEGGRVLLERVSTKKANGRVVDQHWLPGTKRELNEPLPVTVHRIKAMKILDRANIAVNFNFEKVDTYFEEKESKNLPGLRSLYCIEIVEGHVTTEDHDGRAAFAMDAEDAAWSSDKEPVGRYTWKSEQEAVELQVKLRGDGLGGLGHPVLTPVDVAKNEVSGTLCQRVADMSKKVDALFSREKHLLSLERHSVFLEASMLSEASQALSLRMEERAKRRFVVEHAKDLCDFTKALVEVKKMEHCINPPSLQEMPACGERVRLLEARSGVAVSAAARLHNQVAKVAEEYHGTMIALNEQLLRWDSMLGSK